jgi:hypothetical protein
MGFEDSFTAVASTLSISRGLACSFSWPQAQKKKEQTTRRNTIGLLIRIHLHGKSDGPAVLKLHSTKNNANNFYSIYTFLKKYFRLSKEEVLIDYWIELPAREYEAIWDRGNHEFDFQPGMTVFPAFHVPKPFITFDVSRPTERQESLDPFTDGKPTERIGGGLFRYIRMEIIISFCKRSLSGLLKPYMGKDHHYF